jgi:hypothetical protein
MGNGQHLAYDDWLAVIADVRKHKKGLKTWLDFAIPHFPSNIPELRFQFYWYPFPHLLQAPRLHPPGVGSDAIRAGNWRGTVGSSYRHPRLDLRAQVGPRHETLADQIGHVRERTSVRRDAPDL